MLEKSNQQVQQQAQMYGSQPGSYYNPGYQQYPPQYQGYQQGYPYPQQPQMYPQYSQGQAPMYPAQNPYTAQNPYAAQNPYMAQSPYQTQVQSPYMHNSYGANPYSVPPQNNMYYSQSAPFNPPRRQ